MLRPSMPRRTVRAGFTLIELLAVMLIIGILATFLVPQIPKAMDRARVTACRKNLMTIGEGMVSYLSTFDHLPRDGGARFHTALIYDKIWDGTEMDAKRLTCPAVDTNSLLGIRDLPAEEWYVDEDAIDGSYTSYAGRDMREHPIRTYPPKGHLVLVADDNDPEGNHRTTTLALMGDYRVKEFELVELQDEGLLTEDEEFLLVGPGSPVEELQKLSIE